MSSSEEKPEIVADEKPQVEELQRNIEDSSSEYDSKPILHNGEPIISTGHDVSRFVVDIRDDEDTALTFRSMFLGTIFAGMSAALSQVSDFNILDNDSNNA
jgi:hypothetical protein